MSKQKKQKTGFTYTRKSDDKSISPKEQFTQVIFSSIDRKEREAMSMQVKRGIERRRQILKEFPKKCGCGNRIVYEIKTKNVEGSFKNYIYARCVKCNPTNCRLVDKDNIPKTFKIRDILTCKSCGTRLKSQ